MSSRVSRVSAVVGVEDATSTTGEAPETVTVSFNDPSFMDTSSLAVNPAVSRTFSRLMDWKPGRV